jgi:5-methylcytosine-specific restriction protein A
MKILSELLPTKRHRMIDLVRDAGINVSDWSNYKGGADRAASNPKYCYEWSFVEKDKVVVLNLWHARLKEKDGSVFGQFNIRKRADECGNTPNEIVWKRRALKMDKDIKEAFINSLPVRVIIGIGIIRDSGELPVRTSQVKKRNLDPIPWAVTDYDWKSGECTVTRGEMPKRFIDQFSPLPDPSQDTVKRHVVISDKFIRNTEVRKHVLARARGKCEWCSQFGFIMADGGIYLETHHVIPLSEKGDDTHKNVVALCPNHHRESHYGACRLSMRKGMLKYLSEQKFDY